MRDTDVGRSALEESDLTPEEAATRCTKLAARRRGDALAWWPGSPWRDAHMAPGLLWLALLGEGFGPGQACSADPRRVGELASVLHHAQTGRARTLLGRALTHGLSCGGFEPGELEAALDAARAFERGGTFATRRALSDRATAWSGGAGAAWARLVERRRARRRPWADFAPAPAGPRFDEPVHEGLALRLEAGFAAERLALWTARPGPELAAGRLVLPLDELARAGLSPADLVEHPRDERWAALIAGQTGWIRGFLARAWPAVELAGPLGGRAIAMWLGGVERCLERMQSRAFSNVRAPVAPPRASPWRALLPAGPPDYRDLG